MSMRPALDQKTGEVVENVAVGNASRNRCPDRMRGRRGVISEYRVLHHLFRTLGGGEWQRPLCFLVDTAESETYDPMT